MHLSIRYRSSIHLRQRFAELLFFSSRKLCSWDTALNLLREDDIVLREKIKYNHAFVSDRFSSLSENILTRLTCTFIKFVYVIVFYSIVSRRFSLIYICVQNQENVIRSHFAFLNRARCALCDHRIYGTHRRCVSCGKNYHRQCSINASECPHPMVQYVLAISKTIELIDFCLRLMKRVAYDRSTTDRINTPPRAREPGPNLRPVPTFVCGFI